MPESELPESRSIAGMVVGRACPVCGSESSSEVMREAQWRLVECASCRIAYLPEYPSDEAIDTAFEWTSSFATQRRERWLRNPFMRVWTLGVLWLKPSREGRALRFIQRHAPAGRMLDVGCGDGRLLALAARRGFDVVGVESSASMVTRALRRLPPTAVRRGRLLETQFAPGSFDLVVSVSYLEHEPRPLQIARRMHELLRPGGICVHKVPNYGSWLRRILGRRWSGYRWPQHLQYFTPATLRHLLSTCGFEVVALRACAVSDNFWIVGRKPPADPTLG
ncbi:MAG: class I SAM-dependent methyltransferase [Phycisphaerae bacterium]